MNKIQLLHDIGFISAGSFQLDGKGKPVLDLQAEYKEDVLYAFVSDTEVLYIGKTASCFADRVKRHLSGHLAGEINEYLSQSKTIEVLVCEFESNLKYKDLRLSIAAGLEDSIIQKIGTKWNSNELYKSGQLITDINE